MYYSAVIQCDDASVQLLDTAKEYGIELKVYAPNTFIGNAMMEAASEQLYSGLPIIMAGDTLVGCGEEAWLDLYEHAQLNPHVHWEASDGEDAF